MNIKTDHSEQEGPRLLRRPVDTRMLGGVAAGLASYFGLDLVLVRITFAVLSVLGGAGIALYLAAWLLIPGEGSATTIADEALNSAGPGMS